MFVTLHPSFYYTSSLSVTFRKPKFLFTKYLTMWFIIFENNCMWYNFYGHLPCSNISFAHFVSDRFSCSRIYIGSMLKEPIVAPPFHFDHLPTQVPKSPHCSQYSESARNTCTFFGNLRRSRDQFWSRLILRQKTAENYRPRKLEYLCPPNMGHSFPGWQMKDIFHKHYTFITMCPFYWARGCWSWCKQTKFQCDQSQAKILGWHNF